MPDPMIELIMLNPADARSPFPPFFLGLVTRAVWSSTYFRKTIITLYMRKIGEKKDFTDSLFKIKKKKVIDSDL